MAGDNAILIFACVLFFGLMGLITPFVALEFGFPVATFSVTTLGGAGVLGVFNAITSILFWTFGLPTFLNVFFIAVRVMVWYIILK